MLRIRALLSADDDDEIDLRIAGQDAGGVLVLLRRVADRVAALDARGAPLDLAHDVFEFVGVQRRLIEDLDLRITGPVDRFDFVPLRDDVILRGIEIVRVADHFAVPRIADEDDVETFGEGALRLAMDVVDELAGGVEDLQPGRAGVVVKRRRDAVRGEDDGRRLGRGDLLDGADAETFHLLDHALVVHDLPEDRRAPATGGESLHFQIGDPYSGAETVLRCAFHPHRRTEHSSQAEHSE